MSSVQYFVIDKHNIETAVEHCFLVVSTWTDLARIYLNVKFVSAFVEFLI